jgi:diguanylate cyclase (GGDEF)-like protein
MPAAAWPVQTLHGLFLGYISGLLLAFQGVSDHDPMLSFYLVPILIGAIHGSKRIAIIASIAASASLFVGTHGGGQYAVLALVTILIGIGSGFIVRLRIRRWLQLACLSALSLSMTFAIPGFISGMRSSWEDGLGFAVWFVAVLIASDVFVRLDASRRALMTEYTYLTQHDLLTGLLNFQTFQARLQTLLAKQQNVCFILIDCDDVKSLNTEQGTHSVDGTLKKVAHLLRVYFPDALLMGRYGSDEFAVVIPAPEELTKTLNEVLDMKIPEIADIQLSYGYAVFPDEEDEASAFITLVQKRMLETKRRLWLQREAHWLHNERLKAVGELAAGMAHEIRNPLTTVKGFLQVSKQNNYDVSSYYDIIMHEIKRMSDLTAEFLQFSKPAAHCPSKISIQDCVRAAAQLTEPEVTRNGHQLHLQTEETPLFSLLEKDKIVQVLVNIIQNGMDAMGEKGDGVLTVSVFPRGEYGLIDITDTGTGIPERNLDRLFEPFFSTKAKGTGLGLSISQKIITEHGGYISVRSKEEAGTTFTIRLPLAEREGTPHNGHEGKSA